MLVVKNLTKSINHKELFENISFIVHDGEKIGLIGPNGCGKSTLLKIIIGEIDADVGSVDKGREKIGYLSQTIEIEKGETIESYLRYFLERDRDKVLKEIGLENIDKNVEVIKLSGGQKTRLSLAKILLSNPSLIIMDEPTNHLDLEGIKWLENLVKNFRGGLIVVSHDRKFLDNTVDKILEMDVVQNRLSEYMGGYSDYIEQKEVKKKRWEIDYRQQQKEKRRMEEFIVLRRQRATACNSERAAKEMKNMQKRLQREVLDQLVSRPSDFESMKSLMLSGQVHRDKLILRVEGLSKSYADKSILHDIDLEVRGPERILVSGLNGSGKSTLLKMIAGIIEKDSGNIRLGEKVEIGYFSQEQEGLNLDRTVIDEYLEGKEMEITQTQARTVLGAFKFPGDDVFKKTGNLSYGERVRLIFAKLSSRGAQLLILDEPTNHLDIYSREIIENAIREYGGAVLLVSHDRYFVEKLDMRREWFVENCEVVDRML